MIRRWDKSRPPKGPFALNNDSPLRQGLQAWYPFGASGGNYLSDMAGRYPLAGAGTLPWTRGIYGEPGVTFSGSSANYFGAATSPVSAPPMSLTSRCRPSASQNGVPLCIFVSSLASSWYVFLALIAGPGAVRVQWAAGGSASLADSSANYVIGAQTNIVGTIAAGLAGAVYLNGTNKGTVAGAANVSGIDSVRVGDYGGAALPFSGFIGECGLYNEVLSDALAQRHSDPGLLFELWYPLRSRKWFSAGATVARGFPWHYYGQYGAQR